MRPRRGGDRGHLAPGQEGVLAAVDGAQLEGRPPQVGRVPDPGLHGAHAARGHVRMRVAAAEELAVEDEPRRADRGGRRAGGVPERRAEQLPAEEGVLVRSHSLRLPKWTPPASTPIRSCAP